LPAGANELLLVAQGTYPSPIRLLHLAILRGPSLIHAVSHVRADWQICHCNSSRLFLVGEHTIDLLKPDWLSLNVNVIVQLLLLRWHLIDVDYLGLGWCIDLLQVLLYSDLVLRVSPPNTLFEECCNPLMPEVARGDAADAEYTPKNDPLGGTRRLGLALMAPTAVVGLAIPAIFTDVVLPVVTSASKDSALPASSRQVIIIVLILSLKVGR